MIICVCRKKKIASTLGVNYGPTNKWCKPIGLSILEVSPYSAICVLCCECGGPSPNEVTILYENVILEDAKKFWWNFGDQ